MAEFKPEIETCAKIKVVGVGGGGGSAINRMITEKIRGIEFMAVNTDAQALHGNLASTKIPIGKTVTRGLGAGMNPDMGRRAVEENANEIRDALAGADMVFLTAGLGGGTGSGAVPAIAKIAKEVGALTVAVVTKPFTFEGAQRRRIAEDAHAELAQHVDTIITIPNDRVLQVIDKKTSWTESFRIIDDVLRQGVQGIAEMITVPGQINVDFADVKAIMQNAGSALMGIGRASGESRAVDAAKQAIASPLLEISIDGAKGILFTVAGNAEITMFEVQEAAKIITGAADDDAKVIFGLIQDDTIGDEVRITVVATGFDSRDHRRAPSLGGEIGIAPKSGWRPQSAEPEPVRRYTPPPPPFNPPAEQQQPQRQEIPSPFNRRPVAQFNAPEPVQEPAVQSFNPSPVSQPQQPVRMAPPPAPMPPPQQQPSKDDDGEFGIPAFIRRKMM